MFKKLSELGQAKLKSPESTELVQYVESLEVNEVSKQANLSLITYGLSQVKTS